MIRYFLLRVLVPLFAILVVRSVVVAMIKLWSQTFSAPVESKTQPIQDFAAGGELKKDPVCGTYVSAGSAVTKRIKGDILHFCSSECRDKYVAT